ANVKNSYESFLSDINKQPKESIYQQYFSFSPAFDRLDIEAQLPSGLWLYATFNIEKLSIGLQTRLISIIALTIIIVGITGFLITIKMTNPISSLAAASEKLGKGQAVPRLKEQGPQDIRDALSAFNNMNSRLTQLLSSQKQMLGAISHDLRSPLTSLRLRLESVEDSDDKEKMINTAEEMNEMIAAILNFTQLDAEEKSSEVSRPVDLYNFCDSLIEEYTDTGRACRLDYQGNEDQVFNCRYISLRRALRNIIENGLRYGEQVTLTVKQIEKEKIVFIFSDKGPGLPTNELTKVLQPFYRPDKARRIMDGGIGMGLSISESIIKAHGGSICLENGDASVDKSVNKGLRVSVTLPL
ncbi:HAMP domain-containing histidine kinase, partial [Pseudomonadales bacterium]|nr:HAMP domain-containing histidine kinase [Pseudomonadales bacterium]